MSRSLQSLRSGLVLFARTGTTPFRVIPMTSLSARALSTHLLMARGGAASRMRHVVARQLVLNDVRFLSGSSSVKPSDNSSNKEEEGATAAKASPAAEGEVEETAAKKEGEGEEGGKQVVAQKYVDEDGYYEETEGTGNNVSHFLLHNDIYFVLYTLYHNQSNSLNPSHI